MLLQGRDEVLLPPFANGGDIHQRADIIQKLTFIMAELPADKFKKARDRIQQVPNEINKKEKKKNKKAARIL